MASVVMLKNPKTGIIKKGFYGFSWTMFFFGGLPAFFRGDVVTGLLVTILNCLTFWAAGFIWAFFYNKQYTLNLIKKGYQFADSEVVVAMACAELAIDVPEEQSRAAQEMQRMNFKKPHVYGMLLARGVAVVANGAWAVILCKILAECDHPQFEVVLVGIAVNLFNIVIIVLGNRIDLGILRPMRMFALIGNWITLVMVLIIGVLGSALVMGGGGSPSAVEAVNDIIVSGGAHVLTILLSIFLIIEIR